jgi:hypothetical protein
MDAVLERPFYFIVVLWGARFRDYFLEYCLPSLLAAGNLPALSTKTPSKFLIVTRPEDWAAMAATPIFRLLCSHVTPVYIEIAPCPPGRSGCQHMSEGHRVACEMAHRDRAYVAVLTPDCMLSDGTVARLQELARSGVQLVLTAALRFGEEPFLGHLRNMGVLPSAKGGDSGTCIAITGRQMAYAAVNGFHSETLAYEWDAPGLMVISPAAWWRVPGEDGIVLHSLSWAPLLLDYDAIAEHDTSTFDQWTLDGDYLFNNSKNIKKLHVVQDSDEMFLASWGPLGERPVRKTRFPFDRLIAGHFFKQSFYSGFFDPLKRRIFFLPVRWHSKPLNERWAGVERQAIGELHRWVEPPNQTVSMLPAHLPNRLQRFSDTAKNIAFAFLRSVAYVWIFRHRIGTHLGRLYRGDPGTMKRILWFVRSFMVGSARNSRPLP